MPPEPVPLKTGLGQDNSAASHDGVDDPPARHMALEPMADAPARAAFALELTDTVRFTRGLALQWRASTVEPEAVGSVQAR